MSDLLRRRMAPPDSRGRYGSWDLSDNGAATVADDADRGTLEEEWRDIDDEEIRTLMRRQWRLSLTVAVLLYGTVLGVMVASYLFPALMNRPFWNGFSITFLFAAILVYPLTWVAAAVYTAVSNRLDGLD